MEPSGDRRQICTTLSQKKSDFILVDREIYTSLFDSSYIYSLADYQHSLESGHVTFTVFLKLARKADIPYALFFAPHTVVQKEIQRKSTLLLAGTGKDTFSLNSRGTVEIRDIELIIKDILRKQTLLKKHLKDSDNTVIGMLKGSHLSIAQQAAKVRDALGIDLEYISTIGKEKTFDYLVHLLGEQNIFVSQSSKAHMPQTIQKHVKFSGVCIKDKTYPFIFLNNKDEEANFEPQGRRILTLTLLLVCITKARFSAVTYSERAKNLIKAQEFEIAEEILMPASGLKSVVITELEDIINYAEQFSVTPSAYLMRLLRLKEIDVDTANTYFQMLQDEFSQRKPHVYGQPLDTTAFLRYNGNAYTSKAFELIDMGVLTKKEARRILLQNKMKLSFLDELRSKL